MIDLYQLTPESVLGNLPLSDFQVDLATLGHVIAERFTNEPNLPGVIVLDGATLVGVISRPRFIEHLSRPYGPEIHLNRPIQLLLPYIELSHLQLPDTCRVDEAVGKALSRSSTIAYEPIVVTFKDGSLRLVDTHALLLAQSRVLAIVNKTVRQQKLELQQYLTKLQQEQARFEETNRLLEEQQLSIRDRNQLLEQQQAELLQKSQEISELNQRFVQISQILSLEGKKAFQATFEGVDAISHNTDNIIEIGKALAEQLETVRGASGLVREVSDRARHLALKAAILVNHFGREFEGVGRITSDISKLSAQAFEAGHRMDATASHLKIRIGDLTKLAREGATGARALLAKVARAKVALAELENLILQQDVGSAALAPSPTSNVTQDLMQQVEQVELAVSELEKISTRGNSAHLIKKIEQRLRRAGRLSADERANHSGTTAVRNFSETTKV
ncbi:MAG: chemotaxis protein [Leptolyngbyaceae cyanobacterium RU_5_1]|nr:chemotaxis protein [Leptolyngbyaceae cyanobacterium RU_5_1]